MQVSPLSSSFIETYTLSISSLGCKALGILINFHVLLSICLSSYLILRIFSSNLQWVKPRCLSLCWDSCCEALFREVSSFVWDTLFVYVCVQYSEILVGFLFSKHSDSFLIWQFYSFRYRSFPTLDYGHGIFFSLNSISISWLYILIVSIRVSNSFFYFCKHSDVIHVHRVVYLFLQFYKYIL